MEAKTIQKYKKKTISQLKKLATPLFNAAIRERDKGKGCVSCDTGKVENAGHFKAAGSYPSLKYDWNNVHGQCIYCNYPLQGNEVEYRKRITQRISKEELEEIDFKVAHYKQHGYKWDRYFLIDIIEKYK